ncbi:unnamed protein product [Rotaria sp. Silwood1]|nr:unnamed protein product [Rotaria sp. Silwood1]
MTMLDVLRQIRVHEKKLKRLKSSKVKAKTVTLGKIKNNIDNLNQLKPFNGSASDAVVRHIQRWTNTLSQQELEYFALHMPTEPWRKLSVIVHFNRTRDFSALPWFLPFCFEKQAPPETMVARCQILTNDNVNTLFKEFEIPYSRLKQFKDQLEDASKARITVSEDKIDTLVWYYEELQCSAVNDIINERIHDDK